MIAKAFSDISAALHPQTEIIERFFGKRQSVRVGHFRRGRYHSDRITGAKSFRSNQFLCLFGSVNLRRRSGKRRHAAPTLPRNPRLVKDFVSLLISSFILV
jgi:hypothetical protein